MFRSSDQFANHCLDHGNVPVEEATDGSSEKGNPEVGGKAYHDHAEHRAHAS